MRIGIHQIYYDVKQLPKLEKSFIPYDNTANTNREWAEYHVFETEYRKGTYRNFDYTGFVSWKFGQKSRISGARFQEFMRENPGADVYFINPFPMEELLFRNVWEQGEFYHPGIRDISQKLVEQAGIDLDLKSWPEPRETFAFCNYWAGNAVFWGKYMDFTGKIARILREGLDESDRIFLHSIASRTNNFSYIAFIMERLFSVFITDAASRLKWRRYAYTEDELKSRFPGLRLKVHASLQSTADNPGPIGRVLRWSLRKLRRRKEP